MFAIRFQRYFSGGIALLACHVGFELGACLASLATRGSALAPATLEHLGL